MRYSKTKSAEDVIVDDPDAAMRRLQQATRHILSVPKSATSHQPTPRKRRAKKWAQRAKRIRSAYERKLAACG